ncbi:hypothetical protein BD413DRAFT_78421 [Trametes elegans]|nr:hypothetical protein BD413DRAFT_78421 [Trametes elegans]
MGLVPGFMDTSKAGKWAAFPRPDFSRSHANRGSVKRGAHGRHRHQRRGTLAGHCRLLEVASRAAAWCVTCTSSSVQEASGTLTSIRGQAARPRDGNIWRLSPGGRCRGSGACTLSFDVGVQTSSDCLGAGKLLRESILSSEKSRPSCDAIVTVPGRMSLRR